MAFIIHQHISIYGIKNVVLPISVIITMILCLKTKTQKFIVYFLLRCKTCISNIWLNKNGTDVAIMILGKANHTICTFSEPRSMKSPNWL